MTTGQRIKEARKKAGMTQAELGNALGGIPHQGIAQWESGRRNPKMENLQRIADALGVPITDLLDVPAETVQNLQFNIAQTMEDMSMLRLHAEKLLKEEEQANPTSDTCKGLREQIKRYDRILNEPDPNAQVKIMQEITAASRKRNQTAHRQDEQKGNNFNREKPDQNSLPLIIEGLYQAVKLGVPQEEAAMLKDIITGIYQLRSQAIRVSGDDEYMEEIRSAYALLNDEGRRKAAERIKEMTLITSYTIGATQNSVMANSNNDNL